jgi:hypothetical protein
MADNSEDIIDIDTLLSTGADNDRTPTPEPPAPDSEPPAPPAPEDTLPSDDGNGDEDGADNLRKELSTFGNEDGLSDDQKAIRTELLEKHGGHTFDQDGNIIDKDGNIHKSFDDLLKYALEDDTLTVDADGNQVDEDGNIVKTRLEIARETTAINRIHENSGYEFLDDNGNVKVYEDTDDGVMEFSTDFAENRFNDWRQAFFNQNPVLAEVAKHLLSGHDISTFHKPVDYSQIDTTKLSDAEKEMYVRRSLELSGMNNGRINGLVELFKSSQTMDREVLNALDHLEAYEAQAVQQRDADYQAMEEQREADMEKYWDGVEETVTKGNLGDIKIPENEKQAFFDYLATPIDDAGNTRELVDRENEDLERTLTFAYLRFKGYDLNALVKNKVTLAKAQSLRERLRKSSKLKQGSNNPSKNKGQLTANDVTIDNLLS